MAVAIAPMFPGRHGAHARWGSTPCGEYLRPFWQPIGFSDDLRDMPLRVTVLGAELVAFRDPWGNVGLLEPHCAHCGTSLEFGLLFERGIRCCYHGWLFGVDGPVLKTPGEPAHSTRKDRLCEGAYPAHEYNGILFACMGPPDTRPRFRYTIASSGRAIDSSPARSISIRATGCRSWRTPWIPSTRRFSCHRQRLPDRVSRKASSGTLPNSSVNSA